MTARPSFVRRIYRGLEALYQTDTGVDPETMLVRGRCTGGARELLLLREADDGVVEASLVLDDRLLRRLESRVVERAFADENLGDAFPVLEGLSHLHMLAEAVRRHRPVSGLELETQAEVDKLGLCVLQRWPQAHPSAAFDRLVDRLYYRFDLHPMSESLAARYRAANRMALGFSRRLRPHVVERRLPALRRALRRFYRASMQDKRALASSDG